jgi:TetR/AcrR family transcriptional repressor of nem operon
MVALLSGRMDSGLKPRQRKEGALVLARAVNDPKLSDDILRATRNGLEQATGLL